LLNCAALRAEFDKDLQMSRSRFVLALALCALAIVAGVTFGESPGRTEAVDLSEYLDAYGARLFLTTHGAERGAPVLLWLHGGPGGAESPLFRYFNSGLEDHFVVAYWDQRGAGRSFDPQADVRELTVARHVADLDIVVDHLRRSLDQERIILIGHSWGGTLALLYAHAHPEKLSAIVCVAPMVSTREQERAQYDFVSAEASRRHDDDALARLREIGAPPHQTAARVLAMERLAARYGGVFHREPNRIWIMANGVLRGMVAPWEIPSFIHANETSLEAMNRELRELDLARTLPGLETPVFFFLGRYDRHVEAAVAAAYLKRLQAPLKRTVWFENAAHNPPFEEPDLFNAQVLNSLRSIGVEPVGG
jgi:proline iminopeptidase